ncbi:hypothetical protein SeMB42_g05688 [Synchytrium endobioticum]|nr:hypothetical protein SeMB42_g05688 [Synchytrium endobioticum]
MLFHPADDNLVNYLNEENLQIEPDWYLPIIPMVLVNGADGIGTGWSTNVPTYHPMDIARNLNRRMDGLDFEIMHPWFRGFKGTVEQVAPDKYKVSGIINQTDATTLEVTELPIGSWTQSYKEFLETLLVGKENVEPFIKDYKEYHTDTAVHFVISMSEEKMKQALEEGLEKRFKMTTTKNTSNMVLFNKDGILTKYKSVEDIMNEYYDLRLTFYEKRKAFLVKHLEQEFNKLDNQVRFICDVIVDRIKIKNRPKPAVCKDLKNMGYVVISRNEANAKANRENEALAPEDSDEEDEVGDGGDTHGYDYLLSMPLSCLTTEKMKKLERARDEKLASLNELEATPVKDLWRYDLEVFMTEWSKTEVERSDLEATAAAKSFKGKGKSLAGKSNGVTKPRKSTASISINAKAAKKKSSTKKRPNDDEPSASESDFESLDNRDDDDEVGVRDRGDDDDDVIMVSKGKGTKLVRPQDTPLVDGNYSSASKSKKVVKTGNGGSPATSAKSKTAKKPKDNEKPLDRYIIRRTNVKDTPSKFDGSKNIARPPNKVVALDDSDDDWTAVKNANDILPSIHILTTKSPLAPTGPGQIISHRDSDVNIDDCNQKDDFDIDDKFKTRDPELFESNIRSNSSMSPIRKTATTTLSSWMDSNYDKYDFRKPNEAMEVGDEDDSLRPLSKPTPSATTTSTLKRDPFSFHSVDRPDDDDEGEEKSSSSVDMFAYGFSKDKPSTKASLALKKCSFDKEDSFEDSANTERLSGETDGECTTNWGSVNVRKKPRRRINDGEDDDDDAFDGSLKKNKGFGTHSDVVISSVSSRNNDDYRRTSGRAKPVIRYVESDNEGDKHDGDKHDGGKHDKDGGEYDDFFDMDED